MLGTHAAHERLCMQALLPPLRGEELTRSEQSDETLALQQLRLCTVMGLRDLCTERIPKA